MMGPISTFRNRANERAEAFMTHGEIEVRQFIGQALRDDERIATILPQQ